MTSSPFPLPSTFLLPLPRRLKLDIVRFRLLFRLMLLLFADADQDCIGLAGI